MPLLRFFTIIASKFSLMTPPEIPKPADNTGRWQGHWPNPNLNPRCKRKRLKDGSPTHEVRQTTTKAYFPREMGSQSLVSSPSFAIFLCQYLVDGRMSLSSIARRLCCSRQSSTSRLSVVLARLHSTEAAKDTGAKRYKYPEVYDPYGPMPPASEKVVGLADRIAALPPEEIKQIAPALLLRLNQPAPQAISGQGFSMGSQGGAGAGAAKSEEKKAEKLVFDVKLEKFEAAAKIKIIKEIRTFTDLGLKDAKELVEKAPVILKQSLTKEEAEAIIAKIKAAGGVAVME
ncbi:hypothetical protein VPH35_116466 [Triticum aestivum]|nr:uncharacterized protein LOC123144177 isoform X1 [Triticum aestivum]